MTSALKVDGPKAQPSEESDYLSAWRALTKGNDDVRHLMVFDCSCMHHCSSDHTLVRPTAAIDTANSLSTDLIEKQTTQDTDADDDDALQDDDLRDIPPLTANEYRDPEDEADAERLHQYNRESNSWLFFLGILAFINTIFLTRLTLHPHQQAALDQARALLRIVNEANARQEELGLPSIDSLPGAPADFNMTAVVPLLLHQFYGPNFEKPVLGEGELWVPAMWYSSLILTVICTLVVLLVKTWLARCRRRGIDWDWDEGFLMDISEERLRTMQRRVDKYKAARKSALEKAEHVRRGLLVLLLSSVGIFMAGVVGKMWTIINMER